MFGLMVMALARLLDELEPWVIKRLLGAEPLFRVDDEELSNEIHDLL